MSGLVEDGCHRRETRRQEMPLDWDALKLSINLHNQVHFHNQAMEHFHDTFDRTHPSDSFLAAACR